MKFLTSRNMRILSLSVLLLGFVSIGLAYTLRPAPPQDILIVSHKSFTPPGGTPQLTGRSERFVKADRSFVEIQTGLLPDGKVSKSTTMFSQVGKGVFRVDEKNRTLSFVSDFAGDKAQPSAEVLRNSPNFVREDTLLGHKVLVMRQTDDNGGYAESYHAPALQGALLKLVLAKEDGTTIIEASEVKIGAQPNSPAATFIPPDYPVNYDFFEQKIQAVERTQPAVADKLRQQSDEGRQ